MKRAGFKLAARWAILAALGGGSNLAFAQQTGQGPEQQSLNVQSADIRAFIQDVSRVTGYTFIIDPRVEGTVRIASGGQLSDDQMFAVFLSTLRAHGYIAVPAGHNAYRIAPDDRGATLPAGVGADRFVTQVVRLRSKDADRYTALIQKLGLRK